MKRAIQLVSVFAILIAICAEADEAAKPSEYLAAPATSAQTTENLYLLGKVWGYLKYHHPRVIAGCFDWDAELLGIIEDSATAENRDEASNVLEHWVRNLDDPQTDCTPGEQGPVHFLANSRWLEDDGLLGPGLTEALAGIDANPESGSAQHYVSMVNDTGNPRFLSEKSYANLEHLDWRFRLIGLFRFWNIVEYWFPYKNLISQDWDEVLKESIPRFVSADEEGQNVLELMALIARVEDGHANLWSDIDKRPPAGDLSVPVHIRSIEGQPVIWRESETDSATDGLAFGDVILAVDDVPVSELIESWSPYIGVSNRSALLRDAFRFLLRGSESSVIVKVDRDGRELDLSLNRSPIDRSTRHFQDRDGETLQLLSDDVAYLKLSSVSQAKIREYLDKIMGRRGLIIDIRNYPASYVVYTLGRHLVKEVTPFARFTGGDLESPGTFRWTEPDELTPVEPFFAGRVVILVDESSQSQSEYTAMAFRVAPDAMVVGSQTAGTDGDVSRISLPGGHLTMISGIGVFYPDKSPTQKIGIVPDIGVKPTIAGVRAGRDEVLERAVKEIMRDEIGENALLEITRIPHAPIVAAKRTTATDPTNSGTN